MANEADKERAQRLAVEGFQQHHKAKSKQELMQWAETYLQSMEQAISLNPNNDAAIRNLEAAETALASHENAEKPQKKRRNITPT